MNWSQCQNVERDSARVSGAWVVRGTRVQADAVVENAEDGYTAEEIAEIFSRRPGRARAGGDPFRRTA